jgi:hypothetical protein
MRILCFTGDGNTLNCCCKEAGSMAVRALVIFYPPLLRVILLRNKLLAFQIHKDPVFLV